MKGNTYMKFDIVRAWKDEAYRQTLTEEQLNSLPANPAGELKDTDLATVCGGGGEEGDFGVAASSSSFASHQVVRTHSFSVLCDISIFSADIHIIGVDRLINIAQCETRPCVEDH